MPGIRRGWQAHIWLLGGYLALALVLTWPTVAHLLVNLPGDGGDDPAIAWNLWWVKHSLLTLRQNPFQSDYLFYPLGINLAFYTLTVLNALTALPLLLNVGVVGASNLHLFFTFVAGGYGTFLLARYVLAGSPWGFRADSRAVWLAAALAGGFYAFSSSQLFYVALGQFNIASSHWVPYSILYIIKCRHNLRPPTWRAGRAPLRAALFLVMQAWTELTYASFILVFLAVYVLYWLSLDLMLALSMAAGPLALLRRWWRSPFLRNLALMGGLSTLGLAPILASMVPDLRAEGDFLVVGTGFAGAFSADLLGFLVPTMHHPWLGGLVRQTGITAFDKGQHIYLGYSLLALAALGFWRYRRDAVARFWLFAAVVFAFLALGPHVIINGVDTGFGGPFRILQSLPFFKGNRYPSRYSVMLILSLGVLAALGLERLVDWALRRGRPAPALGRGLAPVLLVGLLFVFEHLSLPLPQSRLAVPAPYRTIAADGGDFAVLDIPFAWRNGFRITGAPTVGFMFGQFYQTYHQKPLLQGNTSRNPEFKFQYFTEAPVIRSLLALETGRELPPAQWEADRRIAADVLRFFNIRYIVVRPETPGYPVVNGRGEPALANPQATRPYIEQVLPVTNLHDGPDLILYRVDGGEMAARVLVSPDSELARLYLGEGWGRLAPGRPLVAQRAENRLLVPLNGQAQRVSLRLRPLQDGAAPGRWWLSLNGWQSAPAPLGDGWQTYTVTLPAEAVRAGLNDLRLHFERVEDARALSPPALAVISAGEGVGDFGHIYLNGVEVSPNERGYNVAVISAGGELLAAAGFDTHLSQAAAAELARFLAAAPAEAFVAVAAADEASANLTGDAVQALAALGAGGDLRGCFRCSHAFLRTPTPEGDGTLEALEPSRPAGVVFNLGLTEPGVAALVEEIVFEALAE